MSSIALLLLAVMATLGGLSAKKRMCGICEYCSYICEYCRKPCCTPCSDYDPDFKEDTDFPKGRNGGVRNHPECLVKAKTQKQMDEELNRLKNLEITVQEIIEKSKTIAAHHNLILRHGVPNLGNGDCAPESANDNHNLRDEFHPYRKTIYSTPQELREAVVKNLQGDKTAWRMDKSNI